MGVNNVPKVTYKIYIPFRFGIGNDFYKTKLTLNEFDINDVHIRLHLNASGNEEQCYLIATTQVEEDGIHHIEEISDVKIGKCIQGFFDGLSKALNNAAFFNVFNGDEIVLRYEVQFNGCSSENPAPERNKGFALDDGLINKAIKFASSKEDYLKQAFIYMKEGEYLVDIGRFNGAIIQFAIMVEYLINYQLDKKGMLENNGEYKKKYKIECESEFIKLYPKKKKSSDKKDISIPFYFSRYNYGLSKLGLKMNTEFVDTIDITYRLRNKLAHGYGLYIAFKKCNIQYEDEPVTEHNIWSYMMNLCIYMNDIFKFFETHFGSNLINKE